MSYGKQIRRRQSRGKVFYLGIGLIVAAVVIAVVVLRQPLSAGSSAGPVEFPDIHGLGFSADGDRLYVPAHAGLRVYENNHWIVPQDLPAHDYMGYSATDSGFYSSGHPDLRTDFPPLLGLVKSEDEGRSIETLAFTGESDFHLMGVGYFSHTVYIGNGRPNSGMDVGLYYTTDDGQTWIQSHTQGLSGNPTQIAVHPTEQGTVAVASEVGLFMSNDYGNTFVPIGDAAPVSAAAFYPNGETLLYGYQSLSAYNLTTSEVEAMNSPAVGSNDAISNLAISPAADELAVATLGKNIYLSEDNGQFWQQIATAGIGQSALAPAVFQSTGTISMNFLAIFLTGLTTGGLTCLAVQGGLLATALTRPVSVSQRTQKGKQSNGTSGHQLVTGIRFPDNPLPVVYFLGAKLFAYTALGFLLGALGSSFHITPTAQAIMMMAAGLFMLMTALNMLNIHPIFRYFVIQPPKALTRLVRNQAKSQEAFTPAVLGLMTVFIPCGTTQAMEVLAISSGSPVVGALILFAFVLGTSPTFFALGFIATRIRGTFSQVLAITAAFLILFLSLVSIDGALNLLGSPLAPTRILASILPSSSGYSGLVQEAVIVDGVQEFRMVANDRGYTPNRFAATSGQPIRLRLVTNGNYSCTSFFTIPSLGINQWLVETGEVTIEVPPQEPGTLYFTCGMGMYGGTIVIA